MELHVINLHSLHNPHFLCQALPCLVWALKHVISPTEREDTHAKIAQQLHAAQNAKRAQTKEKQAAKTRELLQKAIEAADQTLLEKNDEANIAEQLLDVSNSRRNPCK